jgi:hypothetical protein
VSTHVGDNGGLGSYVQTCSGRSIVKGAHVWRIGTPTWIKATATCQSQRWDDICDMEISIFQAFTMRMTFGEDFNEIPNFKWARNLDLIHGI